MSTLYKIVLTVWFLAASPSAFACVCEKLPKTSVAFKGANAVFSARFIGYEYRKGIVDGLRRMMDERKGKKTEYEVLVAKFEVEHWWKGSADKETILITETTRDADGHTTHSDCEYRFSDGERYLVYAYRGESGLETSVCTRTKPLTDAQEDLKVLEKIGRRKHHPRVLLITKPNKSLDRSHGKRVSHHHWSGAAAR